MLNLPTIMIVEDERIVAMDIAANLKSLKYDVAGIASDAEEAIRLANEKKPNLILMDIRLNGEIDGIQAAEKIHSMLDVPIVYLTAYADESTLERAKITGPFGYLLKPFEKRILHSTIEMALYKHSLESKLKESENWLSTILKSIGEGVIATDNEGNIKFMNPVAQSLTAYYLFDVLNNPLDNIFKVFEIESNTKISDLLNNFHVNNIEVLLTDKLGFTKTITFNSSPIMGDNNQQYGIVIIFRDVTEQKNIENEKERLFKQVTEAQERLKLLSRKLIEVQESEKRNLARELHDEIGQVLTAIKINLQTIFRYPQTKEVNLHVKESVDFVDTVLTQVRNLALDLRPSMLDDLGLVPTLRWYVDKQTQRSKIEGKLITENLAARYEPQIEITCFRIAQEALNNVIKHANATQVEIRLWQDDNNLILTIKDNGKGFNFYSALRRALRGGSIGILGMQERIELVGGKLVIDTKEGGGTFIKASFPIEV